MRIGCFLTLLTVFLTGCIGSQHNQQGNNFPTTREQSPKADVLTPSELEHALGNVREEHLQSNNALQQSMTSAVGLSVGKVAEKVDAALVKIESSVNAKFEAVTTAQAEIKSQIAIETKVNAALNAVTDLKATLTAKLDGVVAAQTQAGMNNTANVEKINETIKAGGNVNQFPTEVKDVMLKMQDSITHGQDSNSRDLKIVAGIVTALLGASHWHTHRKLNKKGGAV